MAPMRCQMEHPSCVAKNEQMQLNIICIAGLPEMGNQVLMLGMFSWYLVMYAIFRKRQKLQKPTSSVLNMDLAPLSFIDVL